MIKRCSKCGALKEVSEFFRNAQCRDGLFGSCKLCVSEQRASRAAADLHSKERVATTHRLWREKNRDKTRAASKRWSEKNPGWQRKYKLASKYDLTLAQYDEMLVKQENKCLICEKSYNEKGPLLYVDHDHNTGAVRGLLCHKCNSVLGLMDDSPDILRSAAAYLEAHLAKGPA